MEAGHAMEQANANGSGIKQRIHRSEDEILKFLDEQRKSGFSVKEYCEMYEINEQTFNTWMKKYTKSPEGVNAFRNEGAGFATIEIMPSRGEVPELFAEVGSIKLYKEVSAEFLKALIS